LSAADRHAVEKRPSTDGLVDNVDPRESLELEELPTFEKPDVEAAPLPLKEKLITCFWIGLNTLSTLGLIFLSKRYSSYLSDMAGKWLTVA
jgi:hypothetical protein